MQLQKTQSQLLLQHFKNHNSISRKEASAYYDIASLSRRICDLIQRGHKFRKERRTDEFGRTYIRYFKS